jgi:pimeloyl-ACP methyl ester carboxylesterase
MRRRLLLLPVLVLALSACADAWRDYHYSDPVEYYYYYPESAGAAGRAPLFIALLGEGRSPQDCIELLNQFADDRGFALLCPDLGGAEGLSDPLQAERDLSAILTRLYSSQTFQDRFFLAGFADAGTFALDYGLKYPAAVSGVSARSPESYPELSTSPGPVPVQLVIGQEDEEGLAAAKLAEQTWLGWGIPVRLIAVEGDGRAPSQTFARLAAQLLDEVSR